MLHFIWNLFVLDCNFCVSIFDDACFYIHYVCTVDPPKVSQKCSHLGISHPDFCLNACSMFARFHVLLSIGTLVNGEGLYYISKYPEVH